MAYAPQLDEAIRLIDQNDKAGAQRVLAKYLQLTPRDEYAWLWLAYILPNRTQQQQALQQCLKFFPNSQKAQHNLDSLRLGMPLARPNPPPDAPTHAYSTFFGRDLFVPGSASDADLAGGLLDEPEHDLEFPASLVEPGWLEEPEPASQPRLVYPQPVAQPPPTSDWVHEPEAAATSAPVTIPPATSTRPFRSASPTGKPLPSRKKRGLFSPLQMGCLGFLFLVFVAVICFGSYYLLSNPPFNNLVSCFEAVLSNDYPCAACPEAAQTCPECPPQATCAPTPQLQPTPTQMPTPAPAATATLSPTPTPARPAGLAISLPAPLYFLSEVAGNTQIWQLSQDSSSLSPVTSEQAPVTAFDISPKDGRMAYISDNSLIIASADGGSRQVLVTGETLPGIDDPDYSKVALSNPLWSPDGSKIAFARDGIQVLDLATNQVKAIAANQYTPSPRLLAPLLWSPDGARLAVSVTRAPCTSLGFVSTTGAAPVYLDAIPQGNPLWSADGSSLLVASPFADCACAYGSGLYAVDPNLGTAVVLAGGIIREAAPSAFIGWPKQMPDGTLLHFYGELPGPSCGASWPASTLLTMSVGVGTSWDLRMALRQDLYNIGEALWAPDGSLAVIRNQTQEAQARYAPLWILFSDGRQAIELPVSGRSLHWGSPLP